MITSKHLIETQIPYHIREANPLFTKFLEYYYEFQEEQKLVSIIQELLTYNDIDRVEERFLSEFFEEQRILPADIAANRRLIAKHIYEIYKLKGTSEGLRLLLKIVSNVDVDIKSPFNNVLKCSDSFWYQENFINVKIKSGSLPDSFNYFTISNGTSRLRLNKTRVERINSTSVRLYFITNTRNTISDGNIVYIYSDTGSTIFTGEIQKTPSKILVENGGKDWSVGQVIVIPGSIQNTVAQVTKVDSQGAILSVAIVEYGVDHSENYKLEISPYGARPLNARYTIDIETTSPTVRTHTLTIFDGTTGSSESVSGKQSGIGNDSYFLSNYPSNINGNYNANTTISVNNTVNTGVVDTNSTLTIEQWLESKATLVLQFNAVSKLPGKWITDNSIISNPYIVLQDNKYYQKYSYVIESSAELGQYESAVKIMHPAGTAMYATRVLNVELEIPPTGISEIIT